MSAAQTARDSARSAPAAASPLDAPWGAFAPRGWRAAWLRLLHGVPFRRLALWLRRPLKNNLGDWVDLEVWGLRLRVRAKGNLSEQRLILMPAHLDRTERDTLARELREGGVFLDIGANAGVYSLWVASLRRPGVSVHAFEPDPELCARLRRNLSANALDAVSLHACALGRSEGVATLVAGDGNKGENHVETAPAPHSAAAGNRAAAPVGVTVPLTTLPAWLRAQNLARIDALKIDVEGHELDVLEPLFADAPRAAWPRLVICEDVHDGDDRLAKLLTSRGYALATRGRLNGIYRLPA